MTETKAGGAEPGGTGGRSSRDTQDTGGGTGSRLGFAPSQARPDRGLLRPERWAWCREHRQRVARCRQLSEQRAWCGRDVDRQTGTQAKHRQTPTLTGWSVKA